MKEKTARQKFKIGDRVRQNKAWLDNNTAAVHIESGVVAGFVKGDRNIVRITCDNKSTIQKWSSRFWDKVPLETSTAVRFGSDALFIADADIESGEVELTPIDRKFVMDCGESTWMRYLQCRIINLWRRVRDMLVW